MDTAHPTRKWTEQDRGHDTPCWIWQGSIGANGYGRIGKHRVSAHRWVYVRLVGEIPEGLHLDHLCRVQICVNPAHLEPVTCAENTRRGLKTRLTQADVDHIRAEVDSGASQAAVAKRYGIGQPHVSRILSRRRWRPDS